jgi:hypothetical protein
MKKSPRILFREQVLRDLATKEEEKIMQYFTPCISWEQIDWFFNSYLTKKDRERFNKWIYGQTVPLGGVYVWDWVRYWRGAPAMHPF